MALLFDLTAAQSATSRFHGGGEYAKAVLLSLLKQRGETDLFAIYRPDYHLEKSLLEEVQLAGMDLLAVEGGQDIQRVLDDGRAKAFYSALPYALGGLDFRRVHLAYTLHGLRPLERPTDTYERAFAVSPRDHVRAFLKQRFPHKYHQRQRNQFEALLRTEAKSVTIIAPSEHTRFALLAEFPWLQAQQIVLSYSPAKPDEPGPQGMDQKRVLQAFGVNDRGYVLLVSGDRWLKNGLRAVRALDRLYSSRAEAVPPTLMLGVKNDAMYRRVLRNQKAFTFAGYVEQHELEALYRSAFLFLYPTLNEGFGYPPLEAMRYGTPVVSAAVASTTELYGNAVLYVDPLSEGEMEARVLRLSTDDAFREELAARGQERAALIRQQQEAMLGDLTRRLLQLGNDRTPVS